MRFFFFNDTATTEIYTLSLHDALPILLVEEMDIVVPNPTNEGIGIDLGLKDFAICSNGDKLDRKSTRLNSSHANISYAVFCLKKKNIHQPTPLCRFDLPARTSVCLLIS